MSEMIDRIADALRKELDDFDSPVGLYINPEARKRWEAANPGGEWYLRPHDDLESYRIIARVMLEAMREPTKAMIDAHDDYPFMPEAMGNMIDAALK